MTTSQFPSRVGRSRGAEPCVLQPSATQARVALVCALLAGACGGSAEGSGEEAGKLAPVAASSGYAPVPSASSASASPAQSRSQPAAGPPAVTPPPVHSIPAVSSPQVEPPRPTDTPAPASLVVSAQCHFEYLGQWTRCENAGMGHGVKSGAADLLGCARECLQRADCSAVTDYFWLRRPDLGCYLYLSSCAAPFVPVWGEEDGGRDFRRVCAPGTAAVDGGVAPDAAY